MPFTEAILQFDISDGALAGINFHNPKIIKRQSYMLPTIEEARSLKCQLPVKRCRKIINALRNVSRSEKPYDADSSQRLQLHDQLQKIQKYLPPHFLEDYVWAMGFFYGITATRNFDQYQVHCSVANVLTAAGFSLDSRQRSIADTASGMIVTLIKYNIFCYDTLKSDTFYTNITVLVDAAIGEITDHSEEAFLEVQKFWGKDTSKPIIPAILQNFSNN